MVRFRFLVLILLFWAGPALSLRATDPQKPENPAPLSLRRGAFVVNWYLPPAPAAAQGLLILGSGDGGWSYWEERVARHLARRQWAVAGIDFRKYSETDYSQAVLVQDYGVIAAELAQRAGPAATPRPLVYGGWSMGAEQALPAAAIVRSRPPGLCGLLLVAPGARGRYGLHTADTLGLAPTGPGTFALAEFAPALRDLRLAQLHAGLDPLDSIDWFHDRGLELRLWHYPRAFHDFKSASDGFLAQVDEALHWIVQPRHEPSPHVSRP